MNERDFCYWLQGMFELTNANELTAEQVQQIKGHLKLVFDKQTPDYGVPNEWLLQGNEGGVYITSTPKVVC